MTSATLDSAGEPVFVHDRAVGYDDAVSDLAIEHRRKAARRALMAAGPLATPAVRRGLKHPSGIVRAECCNVLDHFLDEDALPELLGALSDGEPSVRARALHALACDTCKEGSCRPGEAAVLPIAVRLLRTDPDRYVRKSAVEMLGQAVHRSPEAREALVAAHANDGDPLVRKVAGWYCPGGAVYEGRPTRLGRPRARPLVLQPTGRIASSPPRPVMESGRALRPAARRATRRRASG